jgi:hypothetical protein
MFVRLLKNVAGPGGTGVAGEVVDMANGEALIAEGAAELPTARRARPQKAVKRASESRVGMGVR